MGPELPFGKQKLKSVLVISAISRVFDERRYSLRIRGKLGRGEKNMERRVQGPRDGGEDEEINLWLPHTSTS